MHTFHTAGVFAGLEMAIPRNSILPPSESNASIKNPVISPSTCMGLYFTFGW